MQGIGQRNDLSQLDGSKEFVVNATSCKLWGQGRNFKSETPVTFDSFYNSSAHFDHFNKEC